MAATFKNRDDLIEQIRANGYIYWTLLKDKDVVRVYDSARPNMETSMDELHSTLDRLAPDFYEIKIYELSPGRRKESVPGGEDGKAGVVGRKTIFNFNSRRKNESEGVGVGTIAAPTLKRLEELTDELNEYKRKEGIREMEERLRGEFDKKIAGLTLEAEKPELTALDKLVDRIAGIVEQSPRVKAALEQKALDWLGVPANPGVTSARLADNTAISPDALTEHLKKQYKLSEDAVLRLIEKDQNIGTHLIKLADLADRDIATFNAAIAQIDAL